MTESKQVIRDQVLTSLLSISDMQRAERDNLLFNEIKQAIVDRKITSIHCFLSTKKEFNTRPIIEFCWTKHIKVFVPKIEGKRTLSHWEFKADTKTKAGPLGILEPFNAKSMDISPDLIFTPGVAFALDGSRIGYGGGYYDQFLALYPSSQKWAACYPEALFELLPIESHDVKVDRVFTIK